MQLITSKIMVSLLITNALLVACVTSRVKPITQAQSTQMPDSLDVKVFLLERDIPTNIERLGVVTIGINSRAGINIDEPVKKQLRSDCQKLGANGAYRINDGTYYPLVVNYLVFRYKR